ncbi:MAG: hypothetical protein DME78_01590 [Verrucomicrobia bacterium]|nr:MAG: hypothetical protein DME78_01590 [Verrucomicrobiota bacterium]
MIGRVWNFWMRITRQPLLFDLGVWSNVRETSQIVVLNNRSHQPQDVRRLRTGSILCAYGGIALLSRPCALCLGEQRHSKTTKAKDRGN